MKQSFYHNQKKIIKVSSCIEGLAVQHDALPSPPTHMLY